MSLVPMNRISMQSRRAIKIEEARQKFIQSTVSTIYALAVNTADTTDVLCYIWMLNHVSNDFTTNAVEITEQLKTLFPDCKVTYESCIQDNRGAWHPESTIVEALKPFLSRNQRHAIHIDWT